MRHERFSTRERTLARGAVACVIAAALVTGCGGSAAKRTTPPGGGHGSAPAAASTRSSISIAPPGRITNTDPCAMRLHDVSGALLLYYLHNNDLPPTLADLVGAPGVDGPESLACPVSKTAYFYSPGGILLPERGTYLVVYDPQPSHENHRWAITVEQPRPGVPLVTKVVALPESFFALRPPTR